MTVLRSLLIKELLQLLRDPKIVPILFVAPVIQLVILGYAATTDVRQVELVVCDLDRTQSSQRLIDGFTQSTYFKLITTLDDQRQIDGHLESGAARLAVTIPPGFAGDLAGERQAEVQIVADGTNAVVTSLAIGYARATLSTFAAADDAPAIDLRPKVLYNPDLLSRYYMVPGVLAMIVMVMTMMLSSMAIVKESEIGTMEQLLVTPLTPGQIIIGKLVPYALVGSIEMLTALPIVLLWFQVPLRGSLLTLAVMTVPYMLCTLGLGLLVSTMARTQQQAMMITAFVFMLPQIYLSGFVFPIQNMPTAFQWVTYAVPLRYYVVVLRGVFLKGVGLETLWPQGLAMLLLAFLILAVARLRFRRQLV